MCGDSRTKPQGHAVSLLRYILTTAVLQPELQ